MDLLFGDAINALRTSIGLATLANVRDYVLTVRPLLASDPELWPWRTTDLCDPLQTGAWILADKRPLPADLETFLSAGEPPVYVGFGSIALPSTRDAAPAAIQAIRAANRRVVLARGWADNALTDDRDDCFLIGEVNQQALFRRVAVIVHHGGAGTTATAARAGTPQIIVPQIVDQPYWAAQVSDLGIGVALDSAVPTFQSFSVGLATAMGPEICKQAVAVANVVRTDGATETANLLIEGHRFSSAFRSEADE
jgi:vancomycin aglycone glucosyltransferase